MAGVNGGELYTGAASAWASGAELVYRPLADALVARSPVDLAGRLVLDVGAGTGAGSRALSAAGARPIACDSVFDMLLHGRVGRPPAVVADVCRMPIGDRAVGGALAPFVLNHIDRPVTALQELARCVEPGGFVLASTFAGADRLAVKDLLDDVVARHGWVPSESYLWIKTHAAPILASAERMADAAAASGLVDLEVTETTVDVGISSPRDIVAYRFGVAHVAPFLASLDPNERAAVVAEAEALVADERDSSTLAPAVVFLSARVT